MMAWDGRARWHAALAGINALALATLSEGGLRTAALVAAAGFAAWTALSIRRSCPGGLLVSREAPRLPGSVSLGRGFEWDEDEAQESLVSGREAWRREREVVVPDSEMAQHLLVLGSTGTGKTRFLEWLAVQAIAKGDAVVVIDPKGDDGLLARVRAAAGDRFRLFSLPHPDRSIEYNPVGRYTNVREVADRIAALLPSSGDALPFRNFGWEIIHTAARHLHGKKPLTLRALKRAAIDHPVGALARRPRDHHLKLASALVPVLGKLCTRQLCPESGGLTWDRVDGERLVVYFSLGALLGRDSSSAVARLAVLDLQGYVGARYAHGKGNGPMWLFADELGDVASTEFIGLLNKSRGAGLRIVGSTQTRSDLEAALGGRAQAEQVMGNANTLVQFRAQSGLDAELFSRMTGERLLSIRSESAAYEPALLTSGFRTVDDFRARFGESSDVRERPLVHPSMLTRLPVFHYFMKSGGRTWRGRVPVMA